MDTEALHRNLLDIWGKSLPLGEKVLQILRTGLDDFHPQAYAQILRDRFIDAAHSVTARRKAVLQHQETVDVCGIVSNLCADKMRQYAMQLASASAGASFTLSDIVGALGDLVQLVGSMGEEVLGIEGAKGDSDVASSMLRWLEHRAAGRGKEHFERQGA